MRLSNPRGDSKVQEEARVKDMGLADIDVKMPFKATILNKLA